jgi:cystathionine beta-synthase
VIVENVLELIGNTPVVKLHRIVEGLPGKFFAKLEYFNPGGSVKDRMAYYILKKAEESGKLKEGMVIVENTSGNTGVGIALFAAVKGYRMVFTIPDKMSKEKIDTLKAFGAEVIVTKTDVPPDSPESYYETAKRIAKELGNAFYVNQYHNPHNIEAHYVTTGPEIWEDFGENLDYVVIGIGTGGTISGVGRFLKEKNPKIKIIGVDPVGSIYYDYFHSKKLIEPHVYQVEGIGEDMLCDAVDWSVIDDVIQVTDRDSFLTARELARKEGIFAGGSSGSAVWAMMELAKRVNDPDKVFLALLPDTGFKYISKFYNDEWMRERGYLPPKKAEDEDD